MVELLILVVLVAIAAASARFGSDSRGTSPKSFDQLGV
jgi:hypothetical protein